MAPSPEPPRVLLVGQGADNARHWIWGHLYDSLKRLGHDVFTFDPAIAKIMTKDPAGERQRHWALTQIDRNVIVLIPSDTVSDGALVAAARARGIRVIELTSEEAASRCNTDLLTPSGHPSQVAFSFVGEANDERAAALSSLLRAGFTGAVTGPGWSTYPHLARVAHGAVPYELVPAHWARGSVAIAFDNRTALEASACGRPVVVLGKSDPSILNEGDEAIWITDIEEFPGVLRSLLADPEARQSIANAARLRVEQHHGWSSAWPQLLGTGPEEPQVRITKEGPRLTLISGFYNIAEYIGHSIESCLAQSFGDFEYILVNDGTPDTSRSVVERYLGDNRVRIIDQENIGQTGRFDLIWRSAQRHARGELIAYIGGDDVAFPDRLRQQVAVFDEEPETDVLHGGGIAINDNNEATHRVFDMAISYDSSTLLRRLIAGNFIPAPTAMVRRSVFDRVGEWDGGFSADYRLWLKAAKFLRFRYLPAAITGYRMHDKSASTSDTGVVEATNEGSLVQDDVWQSTSLLDLYPLLGPDCDNVDLAAAHIDLGIKFIEHFPRPDRALVEFERARAFLAEPRWELELNTITALRIAGSEAEAMSVLHHARNLIPDHIASALQNDPNLRPFVPGAAISEVPFRMPNHVAATTFYWDGTPVKRRRILATVDWQKPQEMTSVFEAYLEVFSATDDVDLVLPSLGLDDESVMSALAFAVPPRFDLTKSATITVERWSEVYYVPQDRFAAIISGFDGQSPSQRGGAARDAFTSIRAALNEDVMRP